MFKVRFVLECLWAASCAFSTVHNEFIRTFTTHHLSAHVLPRALALLHKNCVELCRVLPVSRLRHLTNPLQRVSSEHALHCCYLKDLQKLEGGILWTQEVAIILNNFRISIHTSVEQNSTLQLCLPCIDLPEKSTSKRRFTLVDSSPTRLGG